MNNLPTGTTQGMSDGLPEAEIEAIYQWFEEDVQPTLEGQPSFDDLNDDAQQEFVDQYFKNKRALQGDEHL